MKYFVLLFIVYFIWTRGNTSFSSYDPWDAFAQIGQIFSGEVSDYVLGFVVLGVIALGAMFVERFFCRYLCPLGAIFSIVSLGRIVSVRKPTADCGKCTLCTANCSMGINLSGFENSKSKECIWCLKCVENCPRKNAKTSIFAFTFKPVYFAMAAIIAFLELYRVDNEVAALGTKALVIEHEDDDDFENDRNINADSEERDSGREKSLDTAELQRKKEASGSSRTEAAVDKKSAGSAQNASTSKLSSTPSNTATNTTVQKNKLYNDGVYFGSARGYRNNLRVSVTVKNDIITDIKILSHNETHGYYEVPFRIVPNKIITAQSTDVDGVSGATRTSNGIINAVDNALESAKIS